MPWTSPITPTAYTPVSTTPHYTSHHTAHTIPLLTLSPGSHVTNPAADVLEAHDAQARAPFQSAATTKTLGNAGHET
jgi:hypothetical protein